MNTHLAKSASYNHYSKKSKLLKSAVKYPLTPFQIVENDKKSMISQIEKNCAIYYKNKVAIKEAYDYSRANQVHFQYTLLENPKTELSNYDDIYSFFFIFRSSNKLTLDIIRHCAKEDYEQLSHFLVHSFYENILSASFAQEDMLVLIYLLIEEEVDTKMSSSTNLSSIFDGSFLYEIFKSMTRKEDVRLYLKAILEKIVLEMESINEEFLSVRSSHIGKYEKNKESEEGGVNFRKSMAIMKKKENIKKFPAFHSKSLKTGNIYFKGFGKNQGIIEKNEPNDVANILMGERLLSLQNERMERINKFFKKTETTLSYIQSKLKEYEDKNDGSIMNLEIRGYLEKQISMITNNNNEEIFSNKCVFESEQTEEIKDTQVRMGEKIQKVLNELMRNLEDNLTGIPYSIKCICKIIDFLIQQKFKNANPKPSAFEEMMYIVKFFFNTLIIPTIANPEYFGIITTSLISSDTKRNLITFVKLFHQILKGSLFTKEKDYDYLIFNKFILDLMPRIIELINWVRKTKLPSVIEKLISKKGSPDRDIEYDYFRENPNENIQHQSVCFSRKDAIIFAKILKNNQNIYESESKENQEIIKKVIDLILEENKIKSKPNYDMTGINDKIDDKAKIEQRFAFISKINYRIEFENQLNGIVVKNPITNTKISFDLVQKINKQTLMEINKQKKEKIKEENKEDKELENIKKCINEILSNISVLTRENMGLNLINNEDNMDSFEEFLLPKIIQMLKYENYNQLNRITNQITPDKKIKPPIGFYATLLEMNLNKIPLNYSKDNYSLLLTKLIKEAEKRVKDPKIDVINQLYLKIKNSEKLNMIINNNLYQMKQLEKCINIENFVQNVKIPSQLTVKRKKDMITKVEIEEKKISEKEDKEKYSIKSFINDFPDFSQLNVDDVIRYEEKLEIDKVLNNYFSIVKKAVKAYDRFKKYSKDELNSINDELENYIMSKIYDKLFPIKETNKDIKIFNKCKRLAWIEPKHLIKERKVINENLWKNAMEYIMMMENEKTPADKIKMFGRAFSIIQNSITFCTGKDELGVDDSIQILLYVILKSMPKRISSNFNFSSLFIDPELSKKQYGLLLTQMEMIMTIIDNMKHSDLINVTPEEFGEDLKDNENEIEEESLSD